MAGYDRLLSILEFGQPGQEKSPSCSQVAAKEIARSVDYDQLLKEMQEAICHLSLGKGSGSLRHM